MLSLLLPALAVDLQWLPEHRPFALPLADTRSPYSSVTLKWLPDGTSGIDAALATAFPIVSLQFPEDLELSLGVDAGGFMGFVASEDFAFDLYTFDGLFAFPVEARWGRYSTRLQWAHLSAHYGDGVRKMGNKPENPGSWSREYWQWQFGAQWGPVRPYLGVRLLAHEVREDSPPWALQMGIDAVSPWKVGPCGGANLWLAQEEDWAPAVDVLAGGCVTEGSHRFRLSFAFRHGPDDTGKMEGKEEQYLGVQFGFDESGSLLRWTRP